MKFQPRETPYYDTGMNPSYVVLPSPDNPSLVILKHIEDAYEVNKVFITDDFNLIYTLRQHEDGYLENDIEIQVRYNKQYPIAFDRIRDNQLLAIPLAIRLHKLLFIKE